MGKLLKGAFWIFIALVALAILLPGGEETDSGSFDQTNQTSERNTEESLSGYEIEIKELSWSHRCSNSEEYGCFVDFEGVATINRDCEHATIEFAVYDADGGYIGGVPAGEFDIDANSRFQFFGKGEFSVRPVDYELISKECRY